MHADDIFRGIGKFAVKFRWVIVVLWIVAAAAIPKALPSLASVTQGNNSAFLPASAPSEHAANLAAPLGFSTSTVPVPVVAAVSTGSFSAADQTWLNGTLVPDLAKVKTVTKVRELGQSAVPGPNGVAGQAAQIQVLSDVSTNDENAMTKLIDDLRATIASAHPPAGMQVHLAGQLAINADQQKQSGSTGNQVQALSFVFILLLLLVIFRSLLAPLITVIPALVSVSIAGPIIAELANHGLKVSQLSQLLLIVLVLGAGTDYGLFLVFRVRERLRLGDSSKDDAVVNALTKVGESITFSAFTVIAALLSLLFATFQIYSNLGIPLAIGIGVMLLAGLTLLPALLAIFGKAAFWPSKQRAGAETSGVWGRIAARVVRRPGVALSIGVIVFGALSFAVTGYESAGFGGTITAPAGTDSAAGTDLLNKYFPVTAANPTNLVYKLSTPAWDDASAIATATTQLQKDPLFIGVTGPLNPVGTTGFTPAQYTQLHALLGSGPLAATAPAEPAAAANAGITAAQWSEAYQLYRATFQFVSADGKTIQFQTSLAAGDPSTTAALNAIPAVRDAAGAAEPTLHAVDWGVTGEAPALYDISSISNSDLAHVIPIAIIVIGVLLALVMRSLVAPLYLIASVALSYFAALGLAVILFIKIGGDGGITFILPFLLFIFLLALGEDYNILVMTRIREEAHRMPLRDAVTRAVAVTGTTVTSAGLVLAGTFAVFAIVGGRGSGGSQIRDVGLGLAVGILMDTFVVRTVLVPCTVVLLGKWNWWPSKLHEVHAAGAQDEVGTSADALGLSSAADGPTTTDDSDSESRRKS
ncbi:MMPL family transporter [Trebonia kvetii]|uniref:MMPL family transporter n=1 Tax=Trebonia kvetii TaxID=2480626 RepID=A0A6P2BRG7_9ACTN|nr:MMPL family transporter [Trebonia kvetii]TVY99872.1 MMPL family transporter [Trebonia kvetii]